MSSFDDDVSKRMDEILSERREAKKRQDHELQLKRAKYAELAEVVQNTLGSQPFEVFATEVPSETEDEWGYEDVLPDDGMCVVIRWRNQEEEIGLLGYHDGTLIFEPSPSTDLSSYLEVASGHEATSFAVRVRELLVEGLAQFALRNEA